MDFHLVVEHHHQNTVRDESFLLLKFNAILESDKPQLKQIVWRNSKASNGMDFKPAFVSSMGEHAKEYSYFQQKNALESGRSAKTASGGITPSWRTNAENSFKPFDKAKVCLNNRVYYNKLKILGKAKR